MGVIMKKIFKFMMILVVGLGFIACTPDSEGPGYVEPPVEPETPTEVKTYEVKFEGVETEYWWKDKIIAESDVSILGYTKSHKPSFETKTLKENEEYILEDYSKMMLDSDGNPDLKSEVQYFTDKDLTSPIEPGSVVKNENKTIYIKFVWYLYKDSYTIYFQ